MTTTKKSSNRNGTTRRTTSAASGRPSSAAKSASRSVSTRNAAGRSTAGRSTAGRSTAGRSTAGRTVSTQRRRTASAAKRFRIRDPRKLVRLIPVIAIPLILVAMLVLINKAKLREMTDVSSLLPSWSAQSTQKTGALIEDVDVSGMTREEAAARLKPIATTLLGSIDMTVASRETELRLTQAYVEASTDLDAILAKVYDEGETGSFTLTVSANDALLKERITTLSDQLGEPPVEPYMSVRLNENNVQRFDLHEGKDGTVLDVDATAALLQQRLAARDLQCRVEPVMKAESPSMSTAFVQENTKRIATYTTRFRDSKSVETIANRVYNITKAAELINCMSVAPGEEWSFNEHVGLRSVEDGWKEANGISGGKEYTLQAGGGICQVSTTLYNALLRANIEVTDRKAHSIPSDYVDKGLDATVDSGGIDLKFKNDTGAPLYVFAYIRGDKESERYSTITVSLYGKPLPDGVTYEMRSEITDINERTDTKFTYSDKLPEGYEMTTVAAHDGYTAEVYRDKYENGEKTDSTLLYTDKYRGNVAEITIGTGNPSAVSAPEGAVKSGSTAGEAGG